MYVSSDQRDAACVCVWLARVERNTWLIGELRNFARDAAAYEHEHYTERSRANTKEQGKVITQQRNAMLYKS